ncbi:MAG: hypothetical protein HUU38_20555 [Anaerolineales bacterium]|nr:hypothetical protein [Anaerolineales bacterium]
MKTADKFLIGIVATIILIVVAAFIVTLSRPEETYLAENSPENIVHNYLLALQQENFERAYTYLSAEVPGYPTSAWEFEREVQQNRWRFRLEQDVSVSIEETKIRETYATVQILETRFYGPDLFDSGQSLSTFEMDLRLENGQWKIVDGDAYFSWCWTDLDHYGCDN